MAENKEKNAWGVSTLMEEVDGEFGSQNGLQGIDYGDLWKRPGIPGQAHRSRWLYHKQTVITIKSVSFFAIEMWFLISDVVFENTKISIVLAKPMKFKITKFSMRS